MPRGREEGRRAAREEGKGRRGAAELDGCAHLHARWRGRRTPPRPRGPTLPSSRAGDACGGRRAAGEESSAGEGRGAGAAVPHTRRCSRRCSRLCSRPFLLCSSPRRTRLCSLLFLLPVTATVEPALVFFGSSSRRSLLSHVRKMEAMWVQNMAQNKVCIYCTVTPNILAYSPPHGA